MPRCGIDKWLYEVPQEGMYCLESQGQCGQTNDFRALRVRPDQLITPGLSSSGSMKPLLSGGGFVKITIQSRTKHLKP